MEGGGGRGKGGAQWFLLTRSLNEWINGQVDSSRDDELVNTM
jgi:hypothetical protein